MIPAYRKIDAAMASWTFVVWHAQAIRRDVAITLVKQNAWKRSQYVTMLPMGEAVVDSPATMMLMRNFRPSTRFR